MPEVEAPEKVSQSLLARMDVCPTSGMLYLKHHGENMQTHRMAGGEAMHFVFERLTQMKMDEPEGDMPPDVAKDFAQAMMDERVDLALSADEQEGVRTAVWNWAIARNGLRAIDPDAVLGVEVMLEMEIGDWTLRGKLDLVEVLEREGVVTDYKSRCGCPRSRSTSGDSRIRTTRCCFRRARSRTAGGSARGSRASIRSRCSRATTRSGTTTTSSPAPPTSSTSSYSTSSGCSRATSQARTRARDAGVGGGDRAALWDVPGRGGMPDPEGAPAEGDRHGGARRRSSPSR